MNLYEIDAAITALVDPETGEVSDFDAFDQLSMARDQKIENIALYYKNLVADAAAYKAEKLAFAERQKVAENKAQRLKDYLAYALQGQKFESPRCAVSFRKTTSVNVADPDAVLGWLQDHAHEDCIQYAEPTISKTELAKILKTEAVPGAELVDGYSVGVK